MIPQSAAVCPSRMPVCAASSVPITTRARSLLMRRRSVRSLRKSRTVPAISPTSSPSFGWARPVPVNIANFRNRRWGMALTALAGPVSNFITAFIAYCLYFVVRMNMTNTFLWSLSQFLLIVASMSVGLGVFNLVPVHPLDGSRVVDAFMPFSWSLKLQKYQNIIFFVFIAALWFGWLDGIMDWVGNGVLMLAVNFVSLFL